MDELRQGNCGVCLTVILGLLLLGYVKRRIDISTCPIFQNQHNRFVESKEVSWVA